MDAMTQKLIAFLKGAGSFVLVIAVSTVLLLLFVLSFGGAIRIYTDYLSPILQYLDGLAFVFSFLFLFLCIFRKCRIFAGTALVYCSYAIGIDLWFQSLVNTNASFGFGGVFIGIVLLGVGIYFTGLLALLWAHLFATFWAFIAIGAFMLGIRAAGLHVAQKEAERRHDSALNESDANTIIKKDSAPLIVRMKPYLDEKDLETRRIAFIHCEDEESCKFLVEFKYANCTFFYCKGHNKGVNVDLATVTDEGIVCPQHGKTERYDLLMEDNVCPSCESSTLAIVSVGK